MLAYASPETSPLPRNGHNVVPIALNHLHLTRDDNQQQQQQIAMLANVPSASSGGGSIASARASSADACDERTRLLSNNTPTPPPLSSSSPLPPSSSLSSPLVMLAPPTSLPLHPSHHHQYTNNNNNNNHNHNNTNNNCAVVTNAVNTTTATTNNNNETNERTTTTTSSASTIARTEDGDDLSEENTVTTTSTTTTTTTTATMGGGGGGGADSSDLSSDKLPRSGPPKKPKLSKLGTKSVGLKRVSFGSSKGSMVETLVFETPTPLSEHVEPSFGFESVLVDATGMGTTGTSLIGAPHLISSGGGYHGGDGYAKSSNLDDSGIEVQEESERSIVRVSIYQSSQPQQICPPATEYLLSSYGDCLENTFSSNNCNLDYTTVMAATATAGTMQPTLGIGAAYDRQQSTDSGWDNPFRPGGDLSREADEIVNMIRGGKPITPTEDRTIGNGNAQHNAEDNRNGSAINESVTKSNVSQSQAAAQNGTNSHGNNTSAGGKGIGIDGSNNGVTALGQVSKQVVPGPTSASHVVIDEKKNKKKGCCVVQ